MRLFVLASLIVTVAASTTAQTEDVLRPKGRPDGGGSGTMLSPNSNRVFVGVEGGLNVNFLSQDITWQDEEVANSLEAVLESGTGVSFEFGFFADFPLSKGVGIQTRIAYDAKAAGNTQSDGILEGGILPVDGISGFAPSEGTVETSYSLMMHAATIAVLGRFDIAQNFFATFGPVLNVSIGDVTRSDRSTVLEPDDFFITRDYEGNPIASKEITRETTTWTNILPAVGQGPYQASTYASTRFGVELGLGYRFFLSNNLYLAPNLRYQYFLNPLTTGISSSDLSREFTRGEVPMTFGEVSLNTLAIILQLGFAL